MGRLLVEGRSQLGALWVQLVAQSSELLFLHHELLAGVPTEASPGEAFRGTVVVAKAPDSPPAAGFGDRGTHVYWAAAVRPQAGGHDACRACSLSWEFFCAEVVPNGAVTRETTGKSLSAVFL